MAYTILNSDGTTLILLADGQVDKSATSLTLIGKNYAAYGEELNNNLIKLLSNFASASGTPPRSPVKGQIWYDTTLKRLKVYDNGFKSIGVVNIASSQPSYLQSGDLWFDSSAMQLKLYRSGTILTIGPAFPSNVGENSWVLPPSPIKDTSNTAKPVLVLKTYGNAAALAYSGPEFTMNSADASLYLDNSDDKTVVSGVTIVGDFKVTGKLSNNYLSASLSIDRLPIPGTETDATDFTVGGAVVTYQNPAIVTLLNKIYPPNLTTTTNLTTSMPGLQVGTQARVLCEYSFPSSGYQVRVFRTAVVGGALTWEPWYFNTSSTQQTNVIW